MITRFDEMATPFAALVWGRVLPLQTLDTAAILDFWNIWGERTNPEPAVRGADPVADPGAERQPVGVAERESERLGRAERKRVGLGRAERIGVAECVRPAERRSGGLAERQPELTGGERPRTRPGTVGCRTVRRCSPS